VEPDPEPPPEGAPGEEQPVADGAEPALVIGLAVALALAGSGAYLVARRAARRSDA
jgi:hypothetical protein